MDICSIGFGIWYIDVTVTLQLVIGVDGKTDVCGGGSIYSIK